MKKIKNKTLNTIPQLCYKILKFHTNKNTGISFFFGNLKYEYYKR
jgi:hypothetical protein